MAGITGASRHQAGQIASCEGLPDAAAQRPGPCPLDIPVSGRVAGKPWRAALDFNEAPVLMRHLGTAAVLVFAYLARIRPGEKRAEVPLIRTSPGSTLTRLRRGAAR